MSTSANVAAQYSRGRLQEAILDALHKMDGSGPPGPLDLAPLDEFHVGGLQATQDLAAQMELRPGMRLLDVGSGIGGPARYFAAEHACEVKGIDLTSEFVQVANNLTQMLKLADRAKFLEASALDPPFEPAAFDGAYMIHVGMNISDKPALFTAVRRVLKPGALFSIFDLMRTAAGDVRYPVPWALTNETDFVAEIDLYQKGLESAGFRIEKLRNRARFAAEFMKRAAQIGQNGPPVLGLQLLMGEKAPVMIANVIGMMEQGTLSPVEIVGRAT
jgi:ubiquinone/menaquinone biosynthesis C-methylase UbiE